MVKKIKVVAVAAVLALVAVAVGLFFFSESLLRSGIQTAGTKALGVGTTVRKVGLSPLRGSFALHGLELGNPPGFSSPKLFSLEKGGDAAKKATGGLKGLLPG